MDYTNTDKSIRSGSLKIYMLTGIFLIAANFIIIINSDGICYAQPVERELNETGAWVETDNNTNQEHVSDPAQRGIDDARRALASENFSQAIKLASSWIKQYPYNRALLPEAYLIRADAKYLSGELYKSLFDYEVITKGFASSEAFHIALEREFVIATKFASGTKRKFWGLRMWSAYSEAEEILILIQERLPGSKLAEKAGRALADYYYDRRDMDMAAIAYDLYVENHPRAEDIPQAIKQLIGANLATAKGPKFDPTGLYEAKQWIYILEEKYPAQAQLIGAEGLLSRIDESDAQRMLADSEWYVKRKDLVSSRFTLQRLLKKYPQTLAARQAYAIMTERGWIEDAATTTTTTTETGNETESDEDLVIPDSADNESDIVKTVDSEADTDK